MDSDVTYLSLIGFSLALIEFCGLSGVLEECIDRMRVFISKPVIYVVRFLLDVTDARTEVNHPIVAKLILTPFLRIVGLWLFVISVSQSVAYIITGSTLLSDVEYSDVRRTSDAVITALIESSDFGYIIELFLLIISGIYLLLISTFAFTALLCILLLPLIKFLSYVDKGPSGTLGFFGLLLAGIDMIA